MSGSMKFILGCWLIVCSIFPQSSLATNTWESIGVSAKSRARGGADVAVGDSALSQVLNPATLTLSPRDARQFEVAGKILFPSISWSTPFDSSSSTDCHPFFDTASTFPLNEKWTLGLATYSKSGSWTEYHMRHVFFPYRRQRILGDYKNTAFLLNAAYQATDRLSLGAGLRLEAITGKFNAVFGPAHLRIGRLWAVGGGFQLGLHYQATERLNFGMAYHSPSWMTNVSDGDFDIQLVAKPWIPLGKANARKWRLPQKIIFGSAYDLTTRWKLIGEVRWIHFKKSVCNSAPIDIRGPLNMTLPFNLRYDNQWVLIAGTEYKLTDHWILSLGYNYCTDPVSKTRLFPLAPTIIQHHVSLGLRYEQPAWWIGGGYIYGFKNTTRALGWTQIPFGADYALGSIDHEQHSLFFGFGFQW